MFIIIPLKKLKLDYKKLFFFFMVVVLIYLSGCSSAYRYKTLSFFFDGVPNPATELNNQSKDTIINVKTSDVFAQNPTSKLPPKMNFHAPYQDKACESCHDQSKMGKLNKDMPELCYQCHENLNNKYKTDGYLKIEDLNKTSKTGTKLLISLPFTEIKPPFIQ